MRGTATATGTAPTYGPSSTLAYNGSAAQTTGSEFPSSNGPRNLTINNAAGVTLDFNRTINGTLNLTNGVLKTSTGKILTLSSSADFARNTTGRGASSWVEGPMTKVGSGNFVFPLGKTGAGYSPLSITVSGTTAATDSYTAEYFSANAATVPGTTAPSLPGSVSNKEYWNFVKNSGSAVVNVSLSTNYSYPGATATKLFYVSGSGIWTSAGGAYTPGTPSTMVKDLFDDAAGVSYYGKITIGNISSAGASTLPVKYGTIKASEKGRGVQIDWTAYDEHYLANYQIERSVDGIHFTSIGDVAPRNVTAETQYGFFDALPLSGTSFYRIRNIDLDGKSGLSNIVKINLNKSVKTISVYPNPLRGNRVSFQTSDLAQGTYQVELINAVGMRVFAQSINHAGGAINQGLSLPSNLKSGQYTLRINGNTTSSNHPLIILQ